MMMKYTTTQIYRSSLKLVAAALRFSEFAFSGVSQVSIDGEKHTGISSCCVHVSRPDRHLIRVS